MTESITLVDPEPSNVKTREQVASRLLDSINFDPDMLVRVAGQFMTPNGNLVYPVRRCT